MFPIEMLPERFRWLSWIFPGTYAMQAFTGLAYNSQTGSNCIFAVLVLIGFAIIAYVVSFWRIGRIRNSEQI